MSKAISYGHGDLGRIYEKLRKRSARNKGSFFLHRGYVRGVREALQEVDVLIEVMSMRHEIEAYSQGYMAGVADTKEANS